MTCRSLIIPATLFMLAGCGSSIDTTAMQYQAERLYGFLDYGDVDNMLNVYSDEFYEFVERSEWRDVLAGIYAVLGEHQSHEFIDSIITSSVKKGSTVTLIYDVTYSNHHVVEQLTFRVEDQPLLIRHQFNTDAELPGRHATVGEGR